MARYTAETLTGDGWHIVARDNDLAAVEDIARDHGAIYGTEVRVVDEQTGEVPFMVEAREGG